jgi:hypothetical protein
LPDRGSFIGHIKALKRSAEGKIHTGEELALLKK